MKKILIVIYYWPPAGGAGVQRWLKFVKYFPQFGWKPTVITTIGGDYPAIDESLLAEVSAEVKVIRTKTPTFGGFFKTLCGKNLDVPYGSLEIKPGDSFLKKMSLWIRLNLVVPDARKIWNRYAFKAARKELLSDKYDAVVTSGPPHSTHLVGLKLKKKYNIKWIADFRDPWTNIDYLDKVKRLSITNKIDRNLEKRVINSCDKIVAINSDIIENFKAEDKSELILNGFDPDDFKGIKKQKIKKHFDINYFGNITIERNPEAVLRAVNHLIEEKKLTKIRINFWGNIANDVKEIIDKLDKNMVVNFHSYIPHEEMINVLVNSSLLLLIINSVGNNRGISTGKIFEYLGSGVEILGIGPEDGDAAKILKETKRGKMFDYDKVDDIAKFIEIKYKEWKEGKTFSPTREIEKYSKIKQTEQLVEILEKM